MKYGKLPLTTCRRSLELRFDNIFFFHFFHKRANNSGCCTGNWKHFNYVWQFGDFLVGLVYSMATGGIDLCCYTSHDDFDGFCGMKTVSILPFSIPSSCRPCSNLLSTTFPATDFYLFFQIDSRNANLAHIEKTWS